MYALILVLVRVLVLVLRQPFSFQSYTLEVVFDEDNNLSLLSLI